MVQKFKAAMHGQSTIKGATSLLVFTLFLSNILGFVRDRFLAQKVPSAQIDIYFNAFRLPDFVFNVIILGAVTTAFIPVFSDYLFKKKDSSEAWKLANTVINLSVIALVIVIGILALLMPQIMPIISPFKEPERLQQTVVLGQLLLIQPFFFGLSYIAGSILNSHKRFVAYALAPLIYNIAIIFGIVYLSPKYGVTGVAYGVIIGAAIHFLIQVPTLFTLGYRYKPTIDLKDPAVKKIGLLMIPRTVQLISLQLILLAFARIAAQLTAGSVSALDFADNIQTVPTVIFGNAFAMASFPYLAEAFAGERLPDFQRYITRSSKAALFFLIPSAVGIYLLRIQIVRLLLGSGHFGWEQTVMTGDALGMYALGLVALGLIPLLSRAFFAMHDTKTPMLITIPITLLAVLLGYYFAFTLHMGVAGLALAYSLSSVAQLAILYLLLLPKLGTNFNRDLWLSIGLYCLMAIAMAVAIQTVKVSVGTMTDLRYGINVLLQGGLGLLVGVVVYLGLAVLLRREEISFLWRKSRIFTTN